jgi:hypothetical protein
VLLRGEVPEQRWLAGDKDEEWQEEEEEEEEPRKK